MRSPEEVRKVLTVYNGVHESVYRSHEILFYVKEMLDRGDSSTTIREYIEWCETNDDPRTN